MKERVCTKCKKLLPISEFYYLKLKKEYISSCKKCRRKYRIDYYKKYPWGRVYKNINMRTSGKEHKYKRKGIKTYLSLDDVKYLWIRDKAHLLKKASIDRLDNNGHYTLDNCRIIEHSENSRLGALYGWKKRRESNPTQQENR